jgi:hypothetical protein
VKHLLIRGAAQTCLLLAFCGLAWIASAQERAPAATPEKVIRDFYQWYVQTLLSNGDPLSGNRSELKRYATARLIREIDKMVKGPDGLNGDYFLDAQDFDKEWAKNITVATPAITGNRATAEVELKGSEMGTRKLRVSLAQENSTWKVDKVEGKPSVSPDR